MSHAYGFVKMGSDGKIERDWCEPELSKGVERRYPETHPYNFDAFFLIRLPEYETIDKNEYIVDTSYTDRLSSNSKDRFEDALRDAKIKSHNLDHLTLGQCKKFVKSFFGKNYIFLALAKDCNQSNGGLYWRFYTAHKDVEHIKFMRTIKIFGSRVDPHYIISLSEEFAKQRDLEARMMHSDTKYTEYAFRKVSRAKDAAYKTLTHYLLNGEGENNG